MEWKRGRLMEELRDLELREGEERLLELISALNGGGRGFESEREAGRDERNEENRAAFAFL